MKGKITLAVAILAILIGGAWLVSSQANKPGDFDELAKCLTEKQVKMYGAFWCTHCISQKKEFGNSFQYITYIECSTPDGNAQLEVCQEAGITGYPTWEFADGERMSGEVPLATLAEKAECPI